jgi:hypothetical protein
MISETVDVTCVWCQKVWKYDTCLDEMEDSGLKCEWYSDQSQPISNLDNPTLEIRVYFCTCGGTLAIHTHEDKGSHLYGEVEEL